MSVAFELEYEASRPRLHVVPTGPVAADGLLRALHNHARAITAALAIGLLAALLMLPIRAFGGSTLADAGPTAGQVYIAKSGDTMAGIAQRSGASDVAALTARLVQETGSSVVVPGEHILIP